MGGLQALRALGHFEFHVLVLLEATEAVAVDLGIASGAPATSFSASTQATRTHKTTTTSRHNRSGAWFIPARQRLPLTCQDVIAILGTDASAYRAPADDGYGPGIRQPARISP